LQGGKRIRTSGLRVLGGELVEWRTKQEWAEISGRERELQHRLSSKLKCARAVVERVNIVDSTP